MRLHFPGAQPRLQERQTRGEVDPIIPINFLSRDIFVSLAILEDSFPIARITLYWKKSTGLKKKKTEGNLVTVFFPHIIVNISFSFQPATPLISLLFAVRMRWKIKKDEIFDAIICLCNLFVCLFAQTHAYSVCLRGRRTKLLEIDITIQWPRDTRNTLMSFRYRVTKLGGRIAR